MKEKILKILTEEARLTNEQIAKITSSSVKEVENIIEELENDGIVMGYKAIVNDNISNNDVVQALIELKIIPQKDKGFDAIAERICNYPEVKSVYLMSGGFDLSIIIEGRTMRDIAFFVAEKLATIEGVSATATHFVLQKYKDNGIIFKKDEVDKRGNHW